MQGLIKEELTAIINEQDLDEPVHDIYHVAAGSEDEYPPRPDPGHAPSVDAFEAMEQTKLLKAIRGGLAKQGIRLREAIKVTDVRRYKGSGTGYTIEIETDIGSAVPRPIRRGHVLEPG